MNAKDYYEILGVAHDATQEDIKRAYRRRAKELHPDTNENSDGEEMAELNVAYETLSDEERRRLYDETGSGNDVRKRMEAEAREGVLSLILSHIQAREGNGDIMTSVANELIGQTLAAENNVKQGEKVLLGLRRAQKKLHYKGSGHDYVRTALENRIEDILHKLELSKLNVERCKVAAELVKEYSYDVSWEGAEPPHPIFRTMFLGRT